MTEKIISTYHMNKRTLLNKTKSQLINLLLKQNAEIKLLLQKNMKQQTKNDNTIHPPLEFRDDYKPVPLPRTKKPVPAPRTKIEQLAEALKGYTKSFEIGI